MKSLLIFFATSLALVIVWIALVPSTAATSRALGTGPTGALGILPDPSFPPGSHVIDLATTGAYDADRWVVILDYQSFTVPQDAVVSFANHPSRAAVVLRATGAIVIDGELDLSGEAGRPYTQMPNVAEPGPGGFRGGPAGLGSVAPTDGFGIGGGFRVDDQWISGSGSHADVGDPGRLSPTNSLTGDPAPTYGGPAPAALIGGSGGAGSFHAGYTGGSGGAGGGVLLLGSDQSVEISGAVRARGGERGVGKGTPNARGYGGAGSGGRVRLFAPQITLATDSVVDVRGGGDTLGGAGYLRIEYDGAGNADDQGAHLLPTASWSDELGEFLPTSLPSVSLHSYWDPDANGGAGAWIPIAADPRATISPATAADVPLDQPGPTLFKVEGRDVPIGPTPAQLHLRMARWRGTATIDSTHVMGESTGPAGEASTLAQSWTDIEVDLSEGVSALQVRAELP